LGNQFNEVGNQGHHHIVGNMEKEIRVKKIQGWGCGPNGRTQREGETIVWTFFWFKKTLGKLTKKEVPFERMRGEGGGGKKGKKSGDSEFQKEENSPRGLGGNVGDLP